jgi:LPXTG-motif cell wall-anchored protein
MTVLAAVLALVAAGPTAPAALAQSAGDDQYEDPFAGQDPGGSEDEQSEPEPPAPAPDEPAPSTADPAGEPAPAAPAAEPASQQQPELPRTGLDAVPILAIGAVLLGGGIALRVRLRERS